MIVRKKSIKCEAWHWDYPGDSFDGMPIPPVPSDQLRVRRDPKQWFRKRYQVRAHGSWPWLSPRDWVIVDQSGEFYPCKPDIFEQTYERVKEEE